MTDLRELLGIKLSDGRTFTPQNNPSSSTALIKLPNVGDTFADIEMIVPPSSDSININDLVTQGKWGDDDGDGQGAGEVTASGSISLVIKDKDGNTVNRSDALDICKAPYKVTLDSSEGTLETRYGMPNSSTFRGGTVEYYITLPSQPVICAVRPNLNGGTSFYAGPSNIWSPTKGFLVQSTSPSSYGLNFPTTGLDGLYFDLLIAGVDASQLRWTINTSGSLNATVSWRRPLTGTFTAPSGSAVQADEWITDKSKYVTRVTLHGPRASSGQINSSNPSSLTRPSLPQTFELVGRDRSGNEVRYGFVLRQWFVNRGTQYQLHSDHLAWCNSLGYRMPRVRDLTNSNYNNLGATPLSDWNGYRRHIGAGFFTEWGSMLNYGTDAGFASYGYSTSDATGSDQFGVSSRYGTVYVNSASPSRYGVCTAP
ncbi:hypothetical protein A9G25_00405 [Gilliamella sp. Bif1-4]|nr:hypothetical protein A9G25_00405 [Gilliamella apicola]